MVCVCVMVVELVEFRLDGWTDIQVSVSCAYGVSYSKFILLRILTKFIQNLFFKNISVGSESRLYRNTIWCKIYIFNEKLAVLRIVTCVRYRKFIPSQIFINLKQICINLFPEWMKLDYILWLKFYVLLSKITLWNIIFFKFILGVERCGI